MSPLTMPPPPPPNRPRHSPRSVVTHENEVPTEDLPKKKLNFDEVRDDSSFLAGFSASLKFKDDDSFHTGFENPFREEARTVEAPAPTQADEVFSASGTPAFNYKFDDDCFESNDPFKEPDAPSECHISEATTEVGSNLLADKLLSNIMSSKSHEVVSSPEPTSPIKQDPTICDETRDDNVKTTKKSMFMTPDNSSKKVTVNAPVRNWSRGKVKEELKRRSTSHVKEKDIKKVEDTNKEEVDEKSQHNSSSNDERREDRYWEDDIRRLSRRTSRKHTDIFLFSTPNREEVSTLCDETSFENNSREEVSTLCGETSFENNSLAHCDSEESYSEDDSLSFLTPTPSTHRSRYSRRGRFLCGCDGTDRVAATVRDLKDVLGEMNRSMLRKVRRYVAKEPRSSERRHSYYDDRRPSRRRESKYYDRRSRSISVRRDTGTSRMRNQRGRSYDPPVTRIDF